MRQQPSFSHRTTPKIHHFQVFSTFHQREDKSGRLSELLMQSRIKTRPKQVENKNFDQTQTKAHYPTGLINLGNSKSPSFIAKPAILTQPYRVFTSTRTSGTKSSTWRSELTLNRINSRTSFQNFNYSSEWCFYAMVKQLTPRSSFLSFKISQKIASS